MAWSAKSRAEFLALLSHGKPVRLAARTAGLDPAEVEDYIATHPDFAEEVREAVEVAGERIDKALYDAATKRGSVSAAVEWLRRRGKLQRKRDFAPR